MNEPKRFSRRTLVRNSAGLSLGTLATSRATGAGAVQSGPEGVLRVAGSPQGVSTFDPALSRDLQTNFVLRQLHRGLVQFSPTLEPVPAVAESFEALDGGQRYRFTIRPGVTFSNGMAVDAHAVATSLSRAMNPATSGGDPSFLAAPTYLGDIVGADDVLAGRLQRLSGIEVESDESVTISLNAPSGTFLMRLCSVPAAIVDGNDVRSVSGMPAGPAGTGPFEVVAIEPEQALRLAPASSWFGAPVGVEGVEMRLGVAASNPFNLFQAGEVDLLPSLQHQLVPLADDPASGINAELVSTPLFALSFIAFGTEIPPLDDVHVRRALAMAFPVPRIASDRFQGQVHAPRGLIPQGMLDHEWPSVVPAHDPDAARAELARSRYGGGDIPPIEIFAADVQPLAPFREHIERELGIEVNIFDVAWSDFLPGLAQRAYSSYSLYWGADYPDPESVLWMLFGTGSADNYLGYAHDAFERALDNARQEGQVDARIAGYVEAERLLFDAGVCLPLYQDIGHTLVRAGVRGVPVTPMGVLGLESVRIGEG